MAMVGETIVTGAEPTCSDCGITPKLGVYRSGGGWYVGTFCNCGPYSRESGYYATQKQAQIALESGEFGRVYNFQG